MVPTSPPVSGVGLGYGIAIAVSILIIISFIMLASYICIRSKSLGRDEVMIGEVLNSPSPSLSAVVKLGLGRPVIESYPRRELGDSRRLPRPNNGPCAICLCDYKAKEPVRCIPECNHCFHTDCVDEWLRTSPTCPLCRNIPAPSRFATPLSDLVSLSIEIR